MREDIKHTKELEKKLKSTVAKEEAKAKKAESDTAEYEELRQKSEKEEAALAVTVETEQAKVDEIYEGLQSETEAYRCVSHCLCIVALFGLTSCLGGSHPFLC